MARRILPAQSALRPPEQTSLAGGVHSSASQAWDNALQLPSQQILFNWEEPSELLQEVNFLNAEREKLDKFAIRLAPSMLRIVLTVKNNVPDSKNQRKWLAEHLDWDFRRVSELCIVADSYQLLNPAQRAAGEAELQRYGWSNALKLAYVREPEARLLIWQSACGNAPRASYRQVLEALKKYRSPLSLEAPTAPSSNLHESIVALRSSWEALEKLHTAQQTSQQPAQALLALEQVKSLEKKLPLLKRTLAEKSKAEKQ